MTYLFAEGTQHMYTGTCELYDAHSEKGDDNSGWSCYDRNKKEEVSKKYVRHQGTCNVFTNILRKEENV